MLHTNSVLISQRNCCCCCCSFGLSSCPKLAFKNVCVWFWVWEQQSHLQPILTETQSKLYLPSQASPKASQGTHNFGSEG